MNQEDFMIFAELNRDKFEKILQTLQSHFEHVESGRQGDDWIWIHLAEDKLEIDSFFSMNLEVKGKFRHLPIVRQMLAQLQINCILETFDPPKIDLTR